MHARARGLRRARFEHAVISKVEAGVMASAETAPLVSIREVLDAGLKTTTARYYYLST